MRIYYQIRITQDYITSLKPNEIVTMVTSSVSIEPKKDMTYGERRAQIERILNTGGITDTVINLSL